MIDELLSICRKRNKTVDRVFSDDIDITVGEHLQRELDKRSHNNNIKPLASADDFVDIVLSYLQEIFGADTEIYDPKDVEELLDHKMLLTADHLGGIYSPQSLQGDYLYELAMRKDGCSLNSVVSFAFGEVPLGASTFARGMLIFDDKNSPIRFPVIPNKYTNSVASFCQPFTQETLKNALNTYHKLYAGSASEEIVKHILTNIYGNALVYKQKSYGRQITVLYSMLSRQIAAGTGTAVHLSVEIEEIIQRLFQKDLFSDGSLLSELSRDDRFLAAIDETRVYDGSRLSELLFKYVDDSGRAYPARLCPDRTLHVRTMKQEDIIIPFLDEDIKTHLSTKRVLPQTAMAFILTGLLRGFSWYGGIFQSEYLPLWQAAIADALSAAGYDSEVRNISQYDASGFLSGPIYLLAEVCDGAVNAGPVELLRYGATEEHMKRAIALPFKDTIKMGLFEIYHDLTRASERKDGWYEALSKEVFADFPDCILH